MRLPILALTAAALVSATLAGCTREPDVIQVDDSVPTVFGLLAAGADSAAILVVRAGDGRNAPGGYEPIPGAEVRLIHEADTIWAVENPDRPCARSWTSTRDAGGCYLADFAAPVAPGDEYRLEIVLASGEQITGQAEIPAPPEILEPQPGEVVTLSCDGTDTCYGRPAPGGGPGFVPVAYLPLVWDPAPTAPRVVPMLREIVTYYEGASYPGGCNLGRVVAPFGMEPEPDSTTASIRWPILNIECPDSALHPGRFDSIRAEASLAGLGPNYTAYLEALIEGRTIRESRASHGLTGAYGVFGAMAIVRRTVLLVRDST